VAKLPVAKATKVGAKEASVVSLLCQKKIGTKQQVRADNAKIVVEST
jgi:hypothetical protein